MTKTKELQKAYDFSVGSSVAKLTLLMSTLSLFRIVVDFFQLSLITFLGNIVHVYKVIFHTCFDIVFFWIPFLIYIPNYIKDTVILYILMAFVYQKIHYMHFEFNYKHPWIILHNYNNSKFRYIILSSITLLKYTVLWPLYIPATIKKPYLVVSHGAHGPSSLSFIATPVSNNFRGLYFGDARLIMLLRLFMILTGCFFVVVINYAFSI